MSSMAVTIEVVGPCSSAPILQSKIETVDLSLSIGKITVDYLTKSKIPFIGSEVGIASIDNSAIGDEAIEIVSDTEMRAYGWCYTINGERPELMPNELYLTNKTDTITWFYAYATYNTNGWTDYCTPANTLKSSKFCSPK